VKQKHNQEHEGFIIPTQVNYVGKGISLFPRQGYDHGSISVVTNHLNSVYLWDKIRMQGGAYGGFCSYDRLSGTLTFYLTVIPNSKIRLKSTIKQPIT
jgi:Zn-dependent M16 (insulinase) family peptidase